MVYTITFNPSIDYVMEVEDIKMGMVNRSKMENICPGGKGINVSVVLHNLGIGNIALGYVAGFTGNEIIESLHKQGLRTDFIKLSKGFSRINVKLKSDDETEINGNGPLIDNSSIEMLFDKLDDLSDGDMLVLAGSIPSSVSGDIYEVIMSRLKDKNIKIVVDATGDLLKNTLKYKPFLVKPNHHELGQLCGVRCEDIDTVKMYATKLKELGACNVMVSMGDKGAVLIDEYNESHYIKAPQGKVINTVGAGDSAVAGFIAGYYKYDNYRDILRYSVASGSASAFSYGLATKEEVEKILIG